MKTCGAIWAKMSHCTQEGKDRIIFVTKEDNDEPIQTTSVKDLASEDDDEGEGLILPNGDINWSCPCLGGMASGPCGVEFREAFSCFHFSQADPKGSDCIDNFRTMQECMVQYPELYPVGGQQEKDVVREAEEAAQDATGGVDEVHHASERKDAAASLDHSDSRDTVDGDLSSAANKYNADALNKTFSETSANTDEQVTSKGNNKS